MAWTDKYVTVDGAGNHDGSAEAHAWTLAEALTANPAAGTRINVKAGTYANTTTGRTFDDAGTTSAPIWWRGYCSTIGDLDDGVTHTRALQTGADLPLITFTTGQMVVSGAFQTFSNLDITSQCTASNGAVSTTAGNVKFLACRIENTATGSGNAVAISAGTSGPLTLIGCRIKTASTTATSLSMSVPAILHGCHIITEDTGIVASSSTAISNCVIEGFDNRGINVATTSLVSVIDCTINAGSGTTSGIYTATAGASIIACNCIIANCTNGINNANATATNTIIPVRIHFCNCTNNLVNISECADYNSDLGVLYRLLDNDTDPFVNKASNDFSLVAGAIDRQAAFPGKFEGQTAMVGYGDIGAVNRIEDYPAVGNVTADDAVDGVTGTYHEAAAAEVQSGVQFGAGGTEFTGTYSGGGGGMPILGSSVVR